MKSCFSLSLTSSCHFLRRHLSVRRETEAVAAATASDCTLGRRFFNTSSCSLSVSVRLQRLTADSPDCHLASAANYCTVPKSTVLLLTVSENTTVSATTADTDAITVSRTTTITHSTAVGESTSDNDTTTVSGTSTTTVYETMLVPLQLLKLLILLMLVLSLTY